MKTAAECIEDRIPEYEGLFQCQDCGRPGQGRYKKLPVVLDCDCCGRPAVLRVDAIDPYLLRVFHTRRH